MPVSATPEKVKAPYVHQDFPTTVYARHEPKGLQVRTVGELADLMAKDGPGVWFKSPAEIPAPLPPPEVNYKATIAALEAEVSELRKVNGDLVAKLMAKPEKVKPEPKP